ncbi:hypothetical protein Leryth_004157 [Lithospermum erythrorhizon]|nr:hypothetical protein Leryth_004157 [Lithospermum erythrorhizon]
MEGLHQQLYGGVMNIDTGGGGGDRFPQWSMQETRDFLMIRGEFDPSFMETKRNKLLWEAIATQMRERGYNRSGEQCKCKWKNLVTRYKGCETMEVEGMRQQFPFYNELHSIFTARMQRMLWMEAEGGGGKKKLAQLSSDEEDDNEDNNSEGEKGGGGSTKKKRKMKNTISSNVNNASVSSSNGDIMNAMKEMLEDFMKQQMQMEIEWLRAYEAREEERRMKEMEFRQTLERLENERFMMERRWREREEQRKMREEVRDEKRDALITALLNKLGRDEM